MSVFPVQVSHQETVVCITDTAADTATRGTTCASIEGQIDQYMSELRTMPHSEEEASYPLLAPLAEDLLAAPASQAMAYDFERIFSVCGWLTARRRNRLTKNLEKWVFVRMNQGLL